MLLLENMRGLRGALGPRRTIFEDGFSIFTVDCL